MNHRRAEEMLAELLRRSDGRRRVTASAFCVLQDGSVVAEGYAGVHDGRDGARAVDACSRFNVFSVRKTYIGLAVALCIGDGVFQSVDDPVARYVTGPHLHDVTLRHLLTHTHGLTDVGGTLRRQFAPGTRWHYNNTGVALLCQAVAAARGGETVAQVLASRVFAAMGLSKTSWQTTPQEDLVSDVGTFGQDVGLTLGTDSGEDRNLYVSARELAQWGQLHLMQGMGIVPSNAIALATQVQTPGQLSVRYPRHGFLWWMQGSDRASAEIGEKVPAGAYQIVGMSGCLCLVIPSMRLVAVRMANSLSHQRLTFLRDARAFGDMVTTLYS